MRSTTLGRLTSMLMVLPVAADNKWLNSSRPESRDSINHPSEPIAATPRSSPRTSANTIPADDRADRGAGLEDWRPASGSCGMQQGYHQEDCRRVRVARRPDCAGPPLVPLKLLTRVSSYP